MQSLIYAMLSSAGCDTDKFVALLKQIPQHIRGVHKDCTFHAQTRCTAKPPCPTRACNCGTCPPETRKCFGDPVECVCGNAAPWQSTARPVTCDFHASLIDEEVAQCIQDAPSLLPRGATLGKADTCKAESVFKQALGARSKGVAMVREPRPTHAMKCVS